MFCRYCGVQVDEDCQVCPSCHNVLPKMRTAEGAKEKQSNTSQQQKAANDKSYLGGQDKITMAIICFLVGSLGVHNFMMGETNKGIFRLLLTLLLFGTGWIFALIDFVKILSGEYVVDTKGFI